MSSPWKDLAVLIAVAALFLPIAAKADVAVLTPAKDVTIHEDPAGTVANGQGDTLIAGSTNDGLLRRSPMQFDVAGQLPAGAIINSVTLTMTLDRTSRNEPNGTNRVVGLHLVTTDWNEGPSDRSGGGGGNGPGSGAVALGGDTTWIHTDFPNEFWNTPGGDFVGSASGTTLVGTASGDYTWASTAGMVTDVQAWLDSPVQNMGWFLIGDEVDIATSRRFGSRQSASPPTLSIDYDPPANAGACCGGEQCAVVASAGSCTLGTFLGVGTTCADCGGACCDRSGPTCDSDILGANCAFDFTVGATCGEVTCDAIQGACCGSDASCSVGTAADCSASGGVYGGNDSTCEVGLCPWQLTAYVDELPVPPVKLPDSVDPDGSENYTVTMLETTHQMHSEMPATPVWGYDGLYPGPTIEARQGQHTRVDWVNDLRTGGTGGLRSQHIWPVDTCPHGPNYWLDTARTVVHLHGAHVHPRYDGYPEYDYPPGTSDLYVYPNTQEPATLWYHDHALGITRLNVHLGLAGFYLLRNDVEDALGLPSGEYEVPVVVQDKSFNSDGTIAYPAEWNDTWFANHIVVNGKILPKMTVKRGKYRFRFLNGSGSRFYRFRVVNASGTTQDVVQIGTDGGLVDSPRTLQDFAMGPAERYEIVIDFEQLTLDNPGETEFFLVNDAPILYPGVPGDGVLPDVMRFDVTAEIGHTAALPGTLKEILPIDETQAVVTRRLSLGPEVPTGHGGMPPCSDIQWFVKTVSETRGGQTIDLTSACGTAPVCGDGICQVADGEDCSCSDCNGQTSGNPNNRYCCGDDVDCTDARCGGDVATGGTCDPVSQAHQCKFWDDISEKPVQGDIEVWEFDNPTGMVHPMHMHLIMFQVLERCDRNAPTTCFPPNPEEVGGWKDTVHAEPGMITKVKVDFTADYTGKYAYHCHILEHEDDEMMRQMRVTHSVTDCDNDGICEPSEDCESCPGDCAYVNGAECGNGLCEAMDGEDCNTCAADCDLVGATCCGAGETCEPECSDRANGRFCRMLPVGQACCGDMVCEGAEADGSASCDIDCLSCGNDLCEPGETSASCPADCPDDPGICGDDVCDPGEDACNCFADCGEPEICDDGIDNDCSSGTDCADIACFGDPACPSCGDGTCNGSEDQCSCSADCGTPPSTEILCTDGISNDCDADVDCDDIDCAGDQACQVCSLGQLGDPCADDTECCSNKCKGKAGSQTCK